MRRSYVALLLTVGLLLPLAGTVNAGSKGYFTIERTLYESVRMNQQDRRMASDHALLLIDGETVDKQLIALELGVSLTRGSVPEEPHSEWQGMLTQRRDLLVQEVTAGMLHWLSLLQRSQEQFQAALPRAVADIETRGMGVVELCEAEPCSGKDMSRRVAMSLDEDGTLEGELDKIARETWPSITGYRSKKGESMPFGKFKDKHEPGVNVPHVSAMTLAVAIPEVALALEAADKGTLGDPEARDKARHKIGLALWDAADKARKKGKRAGWDEFQICVNPGRWGGCGRSNVTDSVVDVLAEDKKLTEAMQALQAEFGG